MNEQITIGDVSVSFEDFAGKFSEHMYRNAFATFTYNPHEIKKMLLAFLHTYSKKS